MILVIDNYDSFTWNLVHYLEELGGRTKVIRNDELTVEQALALKPDAILLSPGPCSPAEAGICVDIVKAAPDDMPILGVCLGHQSIGAAFGGEVAQSKEILHGKRSTLHQTGGALFEELPEHFTIVRYHSLSVLSGNLPDCLIVDATTDDGEIMAFHHETRPVYGVQFHPESILTEHGHALLKNFLDQVKS